MKHTILLLIAFLLMTGCHRPTTGELCTELQQATGSALTDKEVQICSLLYAGFSTKEISVITQQSPSSIYVRKTSIRKKLGAEEGRIIWMR